MIPFTPQTKDLLRFWSRVDQSAGPDACWPWTAGLHVRGYGRIRWGGEPENAHRIAWVLENGPIENNLHVLHRCDNRLCCNPAHLFLGTHEDNMIDRHDKGRTSPWGSKGSPIPLIPHAPKQTLPSNLRAENKQLKAEIKRLESIIAKLTKVSR
jgi:hypothetical protein